MRADTTFSSHLAAAKFPNIGSYIGVAIVLSGREFYGTLCAVDPERRSLSPQQANVMVVLARLLATQIERERAYGELRLHDRAMAATDSGIVITDPTRPDNPIVYANDGFLRLTGYRAGEVLGRNCRLLQGEDRDQPAVREMRAAIRGGRGWRGELRNYRRDGSAFHNEVSISPVHDEEGRLTAWVGVQNDITEIKALERGLAEDRFRSLVRNSSDIILVLDADGTVRFASPSVERILGYRYGDLLGTSGFDLAHPDDLARARGFYGHVLGNPGITPSIELRLRHRDGTWRHIEAIGSNALGDPGLGGVVLNARDVTERKRFEERLEHQALHDPLTDLPNRTLFMDRLGHALARAARRQGAVGVLFLDLDGFKVVNDSLGHAAGDRLLVGVAERLRECLRSEDTVARFGGDEFAVLIEDIAGAGGGARMAARIIGCLRAPFALAGYQVSVTASIGIALGTPGRDEPEGLLRDADVAMYRAKAGGKAGYRAFDPGMNAAAMERLRLESDLRRAVARQEFRVHYQPEVELATGGITDVEALARWEHPERGLVPPAGFIRIAEETGLILPIGRAVLREACRQVAIWQEGYPSDPPLKVTVNLSARQFQHPRLVEDIGGILRETGLKARDLELEITESAVMEDAHSTIATLGRLKELGVRIAVDDFGTGYSSLSYLKRFPVDTLKIDKSFVDGLGREPEDTAIVRAVISLAEALGLQVVAEGVETADQATQLLALGCERGQGNYFSEPLPSDAMRALLARGASVPG